jgi:predicted MFS family arabinose efflux permease
MIQAVGAAWMMTALTSSESMVALVQASITLPIMIGAFAAGVLADNFDRRRLMLVAQVFMLMVSTLLAALALEGALSPWSLLALTFLIGCGTALHNPSWHASIGDLVSRDELPSAVSINAMGMNITRSLGPALGGAIVAVAGVAAAFAANAVTYVALIVALKKWQPAERPNFVPAEHFRGAVTSGLRFFALSPNLMSSVGRASVFGFAAIPMQALLPVLVRDQLHGGALVFGVLLGCFGGGAVASALTGDLIRSRLRPEAVVRAGFIGFGLASIVVASSAYTIFTGAAVFLGGYCWLAVLSLLNASVQMSTPRWIVGRMLALYMTGVFGGLAVGSAFWGRVSEVSSLQVAFISSGVVMLVGTFWGVFSPLGQSGDDDLDAVAPPEDPSIASPLENRSGPITIRIMYEISESHIPQFLELMDGRRSQIIRNGGRRWSLQRDLVRLDHWFEVYHFPTWADYRRHRMRRVRHEVALTRALFDLHQGPNPPGILRTIEQAPGVLVSRES